MFRKKMETLHFSLASRGVKYTLAFLSNANLFKKHIKHEHKHQHHFKIIISLYPSKVLQEGSKQTPIKAKSLY